MTETRGYRARMEFASQLAQASGCATTRTQSRRLEIEVGESLCR